MASYISSMRSSTKSISSSTVGSLMVIGRSFHNQSCDRKTPFQINGNRCSGKGNHNNATILHDETV